MHVRSCEAAREQEKKWDSAYGSSAIHTGGVQTTAVADVNGRFFRDTAVDVRMPAQPYTS